MRRITVWFDSFELEAQQIIALVGAGEVLAGEARYSVKNPRNRDSLEMLPELTAPPTSWPVVEEPMEDDSLNCIALTIRFMPEEAAAFERRVAELVLADCVGFMEVIEDDPGQPLLLRSAREGTCHPATATATG